jgi:hypothetical protein
MIEIDINGKPLRDFNEELNKTKKAINDINGESLDGVSDNIDKVTDSTKSLKAQLREMTQELQGLEPGSERFNELSIAAGKLKDTINDTNAVIKATAGSAVENLGTALTGVAGVGISAFQGIASAQALFGVESKKLQETLVRLQALAGLSDAIKSLGGLKDTFVAVKASVIALTSQMGLFATAEATATAATVTQTTATEGATVAQTALNTSMLANPIFLVIAAIAALAAAYYAFSEDTETATKENDKLNASLEETSKIVERSNAKLIKAQENRVSLRKSQGATEKELLNEEIILIKTRDAARKAEIDQLEYEITQKGNLRKKAYKEENFELGESITKEIKARYERIKDLKSLEGQAGVDIEILKNNFNKKEVEGNKDKNKKVTKNNKDKNLEIKKQEEELQKEIDQIQLNNYLKTLSEQEAEITLVQQKYFDLEQKAKGNADQLAIIEEAKLNAINEVKVKYAQIELDIQDKKAEEDKKLEEKKAEDKKNARDRELAAELSLRDTDLQRKIEILEQQRAIELENKDLTESEKLAISQKYIDLEYQAKVAAAQAEIGIASDVANSIANLTQFIFEIKTKKLEEGSVEEDKQARRRFKINKALQLGLAVIDAAKAVTTSLAASPLAYGPVPNPAGIASLATAITSSAVNIAKIAATQYESKSTGGASVGGGVGGGGESSSSSIIPKTNLFGSANTGGTTTAGGTSAGQNINVSATISVEEITNTQNRMTKLKEIGSL